MEEEELKLAPPTVKSPAERLGHKPGTQPTSTADPSREPPRRGFFYKAFTSLVGLVLVAVPLASGIAVFLDPLRRKKSNAGFVRVTTLDSLPADGTPRQFPIVADRQDAWNRYPAEPVGAVYVRRLPGTDQVQAFNAICPHAGCFVAYKPDRESFQCPCHTSSFALDGKRIEPSPSPRPLDELETEVVGQRQEVRVKFVNYYSGLAEKKPKA